MPEIILTNPRTIRRKLRNFGITGLMLAGLYLGRGFIKDSSERIQEYYNYKKVERQINSDDYREAREKLIDFKDILPKEKISELEARLQSIHPDSLLARSPNTDLYTQKDLTIKAHNAYLSLGKDTFDADKKYIEANLNEISLDLNRSFNGRPEDPIINRLNEIKKDSLFTKLGENNLNPKREKVYGPILNDFVNATINYIRSFKSIGNGKYESYNKYIEPALTFTFDITSKMDPAKNQQYAKQLIDAYAQLTKSLIDDKYEWKNIIKTLYKLKGLEGTYNYRNALFDTEKFILEYANKVD